MRRATLQSANPLKARYALPLAILLVAAGYVAAAILAAAPGADYLVSTASITGNATKVSNAGAIGGQMVVFGSTPTPTATPTPTPTAAPAPGGCALPKYPDASCTGVPAGTILTNATDMTITTPGAVISGKNITGCIDVRAPGVIIKNSRITCYDFLGIQTNGAAESGTPLVIQDSDISCNDSNGHPGPGTAITGLNFNSFRNNIHGCENGFSNDGNNDIEDNYIHDLFQGDAGHPDPHTDGLQSPEGSNTIVNHNNFDIAGNNVTSNIIYNNPNVTTTHNVTISNNLFAGGGYTVYCPRATDPNFFLTNNRFSTKYFPKVGEYGP
ncbi:MAG TPA: hypothetical protein VHQ86_03385, partial [Candidatus Saccharimonadia bacterium]|nr:hypothetical protein [Candidatus Saccharimonadia bacterium]